MSAETTMNERKDKTNEYKNENRIKKTKMYAYGEKVCLMCVTQMLKKRTVDASSTSNKTIPWIGTVIN